MSANKAHIQETYCELDKIEITKLISVFSKTTMRKKKSAFRYPDRESNSELSFRRALLYPFNYQGITFRGAKVRKNCEK